MSMIHISSLADAERKWGPLIYNDLEAVKKKGGDRPDWSDGDEFVRWAGEEYWVEEEEDIGLCGSCKIQLDHLRDGTEEDGHRCNNCYYEEEGLDKGASLITPDYRKEEEEEEDDGLTPMEFIAWRTATIENPHLAPATSSEIHELFVNGTLTLDATTKRNGDVRELFGW